MRGRLGQSLIKRMPSVVVLIVSLPALTHACAVCVGSSPEDAGYFWGVLFLMFMPFAVGGLIGGWLLYHFRRARRSSLPAGLPSVVEGPGRHLASIIPTPKIGPDGSQSLHA